MNLIYCGSIMLKYKFNEAYLRIHILLYNSIMIIDSRHRLTVIKLACCDW